MARNSAIKDTTKKKRPAPPHAWKPGQSGNPAGAPKRGQSWKEIITEESNKTADEIATELGSNDLGRAYRQMPRGVPMMRLVVRRVFSALMFEPQSGLFNALMERAEGKVPQPIDMTWRDEAAREGYNPDELFARLVAESRKRAALAASGDSGSLADSEG